MYNTILFDLDGTLTDSGIGIINSVIYALEKFDIHVNDRAELYSFLGPPLAWSFENYCGFGKERAEEAVKIYREYYSKKGIYENRPYDGIKELLAELKASGKSLIVATSKAEKFADEVLRHFGLYEFFDYVVGSNLDGTRSKKSEVISYALIKAAVQKKESVVMVGDRKHDIIGAKEVGIDSLGVLYGYGSREELLTAGADYLAEDVKSMGEFLTRENY